ncbi:MAG: InlB B-repeat-containing protein, partial [Solirubrobacterales bacterium]
MAIAPDGATTVVWQRSNGPNDIIQAATRPAGSGAFGAPENLSEAGQDALNPQVAIAPDGATTVVWYRSTDTGFVFIQAATRPAGSGTFGAPENLSETGQDAFNPQVAVAPDGATTVVWERSNGSNAIIQAATRPAGSGTFGAPENLSEAGQDAFNPQVAVAPDGATTVVWSRDNGTTNFIIQAATRPAGSGTFGAPQNLSEAGQSAFYPQMAIAPDGATTVVWLRSNGTNNIIQAVSSEPTPYQLSVTKSGDGTGTITSTPAGIDCGASCQAQFNLGTEVTLTATAASGSTFSGWSGSGCSGTGTCSVTMSEAMSVTATFDTDSPKPPPAPKVTVSSGKSKVTKKSVLITSRVKVPGKGRITQRATARKGKKPRTWCKAS